jgi:hypothetical protein
MIEELQVAIYNKLSNIHECSLDELPKDPENNDFDFNNIGMFFTLNTALGLGSRNTFTLEIYLISINNNKLAMQSLVEEIDQQINNVPFDGAIIKRSGVWINSFIDDDGLQNILLTYSVDKF